ncbi:prepilin peptidase [bacterium]|nr:prepilin peptidase [bacterium]
MDQALFLPVVVFATLIGLAIGSFLNVVIHRVPAGESIVHPPSHCPSCDRRIRWYENVPLLSWILLGGKCKGCRAQISARYPLVELLGGLVPLLCLLEFGLTWKALLGIVMGWNLIALGFIDFETKLVPDVLVLTLGVPGLILQFLAGSWSGLLLAVVSSLILGGFFWLTRKLASLWMGEEAMGMGDVTLALGIGVYLHPLFLPVFLLIASVSVLVAALIWAWARKVSLREVEIPFGPGLALGGWVTFMAGLPLMDGLMRLVQPLLN